MTTSQDVLIKKMPFRNQPKDSYQLLIYTVYLSRFEAKPWWIGLAQCFSICPRAPAGGPHSWAKNVGRLENRAGKPCFGHLFEVCCC